MVVQRFARFQSDLGNLGISQDICYVRMTDINDFLSIYGHRAHLLNKHDTKASRDHLFVFPDDINGVKQANY